MSKADRFAQSNENGLGLILLAAAAGGIVLAVGLFRRIGKRQKQSQQEIPENVYWYTGSPFGKGVYHRGNCEHVAKMGREKGWRRSQRELFEMNYRPCMSCMPDRYPYDAREWTPDRSMWM